MTLSSASIVSNLNNNQSNNSVLFKHLKDHLHFTLLCNKNLFILGVSDNWLWKHCVCKYIYKNCIMLSHGGKVIPNYLRQLWVTGENSSIIVFNYEW